MNTLRRHLPPLTWIALMAMLALVLMPTLSHAVAHAQGRGSDWAEVCTPQGMRLVTVEAAVDGDSAPAATAGILEHCPYCAPSAADPFLPTDAALAAGLQPPADAVPRRFLQAVQTQFGWATALPRGPPQTA